MSNTGSIDVSPEELDRVHRRAAIRAGLKAEFNREYYNPYRQIYRIEFHDPALERFTAARASRVEFIKPTWRTFLLYFGSVFIPILAGSHVMRNQKIQEERMYRAGMIPYADQPYKLIRVPSNIHQMG